MDFISRSYKILGYDGPVPEGFTLGYVGPSQGFIIARFEKTTPIPNSTMNEYVYLVHIINQYGTVVSKVTEVYQRAGTRP